MSMEEAEARNLGLADRLGITAPDVIVMNGTGATDETVDLDGLVIVVVDREERIIVAQHGWGASGSHLNVRTYVGWDRPEQTEPKVIQIDRDVSIYTE